jgi:hypothetical protein
VVRQNNSQISKREKYLEQAAEMAAALEEREMQAAHSRPRARESVERKYGIPASLLHSLRHRPPKTIAADIFDRLLGAVESQAAEQIRNLENEIASVMARRLGANDRRLRAAHVALLRAQKFLKR